MNRKQLIITGSIAGGAILAVLLWLAWCKREALREAVPAWLASNQPPETITPEMLTLSPLESYAANRCRPMVASCGEFTAGRRTRRVYPDTLESDPNSLIRAAFEIGGSI